VVGSCLEDAAYPVACHLLVILMLLEVFQMETYQEAFRQAEESSLVVDLELGLDLEARGSQAEEMEAHQEA
jgi:hypothetical protein